MEPVRIAMLGSSFVDGSYTQGFADVRGDVVVANYSRSLKRPDEFAAQWNIKHLSTDLDQLLARTDIDLYITALPNEEHLPVCLKLSEAGENQVCTKPLGETGMKHGNCAICRCGIRRHARLCRGGSIRARGGQSEADENGGIGKFPGSGPASRTAVHTVLSSLIQS